MSVSLKAGGNWVVYTGKAQSAGDALASIMSYLDPTSVIYYWDNVAGYYKQVITTTLMAPYGCYWIVVTQGCTWTYGVDETAPTSVQLYARWNYVPYLGPVQSVQDAFASIISYLVLYYYFDNVLKYWKQTPTMVPGGVYAVKVNQSCVWTFAEPFRGTITETVLEYDSSQVAIPASNIPQGKSVRVYIWGRNDMTTTQYMAMHWIVKDPDGLEVDSYSPGEVWPSISSGGQLGFRGGYFNVNKVGTYTINAGLLMNPDNPTYVDTYYGTLCSVAAVVPQPEFQGFGIADYSKV